ncbi:MAG TPA: hypothetical protein VGF30_04750 [Bacteroidia bacterium]
MKKHLVILLAILVFITACGPDKKEGEVSIVASNIAIIGSVVKDAEIIEANPDLEAVLQLFPITEKTPFALTSEQIDKIEGKGTLKTKQVRLLSQSVAKNALFLEVEYALNDFYKIDSVKARGTYKDWADQRDLGQTQQSDVYPLYKIETGNASYVLFWMLDYSTVEACPYSWAKTVFATAIHKNKVGETIVFAEHSGGGDAPVSFDRRIKGNLDEDWKITLNLKEELDQDEPKIEITEGLYELEMKDGIVVFTKEDKKKPRQEKKKL